MSILLNDQLRECTLCKLTIVLMEFLTDANAILFIYSTIAHPTTNDKHISIHQSSQYYSATQDNYWAPEIEERGIIGELWHERTWHCVTPWQWHNVTLGRGRAGEGDWSIIRHSYHLWFNQSSVSCLWFHLQSGEFWFFTFSGFKFQGCLA